MEADLRIIEDFLRVVLEAIATILRSTSGTQVQQCQREGRSVNTGVMWNRLQWVMMGLLSTLCLTFLIKREADPHRRLQETKIFTSSQSSETNPCLPPSSLLVCSQRNPELVYALLQRQEDISRFSSSLAGISGGGGSLSASVSTFSMSSSRHLSLLGPLSAVQEVLTFFNTRLEDAFEEEHRARGGIGKWSPESSEWDVTRYGTMRTGTGCLTMGCNDERADEDPSI
jgi:hypothetical protein